MALMDQASLDTIRRLSARLAAEAEDLARYDAYYHGQQGKRLSGTTWNKLFAGRFSGFAENFCGLVVDAVADRLEVQGFRLPSAAAPRPEETDPDAWRIWQDNSLDAESQVAHIQALVKRRAYVLVSPFRADFIGTSPRITIEDPLEVIVEHRAGTRERVVGMKRWYDDREKRTFVNLYFPARIEKWQSGLRRWANQHGGGVIEQPDDWERRLVPGETWPLRNPLGIVPIVALRNRPGLGDEGESEIAQVMPIQDAINTLAMNELIASETSAFRQKWATGLEIPKDPETGKDMPGFRPDLERILSTAAPDAKFGTFEASDLGQYGAAIDRHIQRLASISQTPYHFFLQHSGQPPAAASLKASETPLVGKCKARQRHFGEAWEEVIRLAFAVQDDPRADVTNAETRWADPETVSDAERTDAALKRRSVKVPLKQLWKDLGYSPAEIGAFAAMLREEAALIGGTLAEPVTPEVPGLTEQVREQVSP